MLMAFHSPFASNGRKILKVFSAISIIVISSIIYQNFAYFYNNIAIQGASQ